MKVTQQIYLLGCFDTKSICLLLQFFVPLSECCLDLKIIFHKFSKFYLRAKRSHEISCLLADYFNLISRWSCWLLSVFFFTDRVTLLVTGRILLMAIDLGSKMSCALLGGSKNRIFWQTRWSSSLGLQASCSELVLAQIWFDYVFMNLTNVSGHFEYEEENHIDVIPRSVYLIVLFIKNLNQKY